MLTEHLDYTDIVKSVATSAKRGLGLLMAKPTCNKGIPFNFFTKLYEGLVLSIINDGSAARTATTDVVATSRLIFYTHAHFLHPISLGLQSLSNVKFTQQGGQDYSKEFLASVKRHGDRCYTHCDVTTTRPTRHLSLTCRIISGDVV